MSSNRNAVSRAGRAAPRVRARAVTERVGVAVETIATIGRVPIERVRGDRPFFRTWCRRRDLESARGRSMTVGT